MRQHMQQRQIPPVSVILDPRKAENEPYFQRTFWTYVQALLAKNIYYVTSDFPPFRFRNASQPEGRIVCSLEIGFCLTWRTSRGNTNEQGYKFEVFQVDNKIEKIEDQHSTDRTRVIFGIGALVPQANQKMVFVKAPTAIKFRLLDLNSIGESDRNFKIIPENTFSFLNIKEPSPYFSTKNDMDFSRHVKQTVKPVTLFCSDESNAVVGMVVTDKHEGETVYDFWAKNLMNPNIDLILEIAIWIGRELQLFHNKKIVHLDIKMENFIVNVKQVLKNAVLFDNEFCRMSSNTTEKKNATPTHAAPEITIPKMFATDTYKEMDINTVVNQRADIYSYGKILSYLFGGIYEDEDPTRESFIEHEGHPVKLFYYYPCNNIDEKHLEALTDLIHRATIYNPDKRIDLESLLNGLTQVLCERRQMSCKAPEAPLILDADQRAQSAKKKLNDIVFDTSPRNDSHRTAADVIRVLNQFQAVMNEVFDQLPNHPLAVQQFIDRLGVKAFLGSSLQEITEKCQSTFSQIQEGFKFWKEINDLMKKIKDKTGLESLINVYEKDSAKLIELSREAPFTLDHVIFYATKLEHYLKKSAKLRNELMLRNKKQEEQKPTPEKHKLNNAPCLEQKTSPSGFFSSSVRQSLMLQSQFHFTNRLRKP